MKKITIENDAVEDLYEQWRFICDDNPDAARQSLLEADKAFDLLLEMPHIGSVYDSSNPRLDHLRTWPVHGFEQHIIFYKTTDQGIDIIRILHAKRDFEKQV